MGLQVSHLFDQLYKREEEVVVKEVSKEEDDARVCRALSSSSFYVNCSIDDRSYYTTN